MKIPFAVPLICVALAGPARAGPSAEIRRGLRELSEAIAPLQAGDVDRYCPAGEKRASTIFQSLTENARASDGETLLPLLRSGARLAAYPCGESANPAKAPKIYADLSRMIGLVSAKLPAEAPLATPRPDAPSAGDGPAPAVSSPQEKTRKTLASVPPIEPARMFDGAAPGLPGAPAFEKAFAAARSDPHAGNYFKPEALGLQGLPRDTRVYLHMGQALNGRPEGLGFSFLDRNKPGLLALFWSPGGYWEAKTRRPDGKIEERTHFGGGLPDGLKVTDLATGLAVQDGEARIAGSAHSPILDAKGSRIGAVLRPGPGGHMDLNVLLGNLLNFDQAKVFEKFLPDGKAREGTTRLEIVDGSPRLSYEIVEAGGTARHTITLDGSGRPLHVRRGSDGSGEFFGGEGQSLGKWRLDGKGTLFSFGGQSFHAGAGDELELGPDGGSVMVMSPAGKDRKVLRVVALDRSDTSMIADGRVQVRRDKDGAVVFVDARNFKGLDGSADLAAGLDLVPSEFLTQQARARFQEFLRRLGGFDPHLKPALDSGRAAVSIRGGQLELLLNQGTEERPELVRIEASGEGDGVRAFVTSSQGDMEWRFSSDFNQAEQWSKSSNPADIAETGGYRPDGRFELRGSKWDWFPVARKPEPTEAETAVKKVGSVKDSLLKGGSMVMDAMFAVGQTVTALGEGTARKGYGRLFQDPKSIEAAFSVLHGEISIYQSRLAQGFTAAAGIDAARSAFASAKRKTDAQAWAALDQYLEEGVRKSRAGRYDYIKIKNDPISEPEKERFAFETLGYENVAKAYSEEGGVVGYGMAIGISALKMYAEGSLSGPFNEALYEGVGAGLGARTSSIMKAKEREHRFMQRLIIVQAADQGGTALGSFLQRNNDGGWIAVGSLAKQAGDLLGMQLVSWAIGRVVKSTGRPMTAEEVRWCEDNQEALLKDPQLREQMRRQIESALKDAEEKKTSKAADLARVMQNRLHFLGELEVLELQRARASSKSAAPPSPSRTVELIGDGAYVRGKHFDPEAFSRLDAAREYAKAVRKQINYFESLKRQFGGERWKLRKELEQLEVKDPKNPRVEELRLAIEPAPRDKSVEAELKRLYDDEIPKNDADIRRLTAEAGVEQPFAGNVESLRGFTPEEQHRRLDAKWTKQKTPGQWVYVAGDLHLEPDASAPANLRWNSRALETIRRDRPGTVLIMGDVLDAPKWGKTDPALKRQAMLKVFAQISEAMGFATPAEAQGRIFLVEGNHEHPRAVDGAEAYVPDTPEDVGKGTKGQKTAYAKEAVESLNADLKAKGVTVLTQHPLEFIRIPAPGAKPAYPGGPVPTIVIGHDVPIPKSDRNLGHVLSQRDAELPDADAPALFARETDKFIDVAFILADRHRPYSIVGPLYGPNGEITPGKRLVVASAGTFGEGRNPRMAACDMFFNFGPGGDGEAYFRDLETGHFTVPDQAPYHLPSFEAIRDRPELTPIDGLKHAAVSVRGPPEAVEARAKELAGEKAEPRWDNAAVLEQARVSMKTPGEYTKPTSEFALKLNRDGAPPAKLLRPIGVGASGTVFEAEVEGRTVAVKVFRGETSASRLASIEGELAHLNLLAEAAPGMTTRGRLVDLGPGGVGFAMELVHSEPLEELPPELAAAIPLEEARKAYDAVSRLRAKGVDIADPEIRVLDRDQTIDGVARKKGEVFFLDAGGFRPAHPDGIHNPREMANWIIGERAKGLFFVESGGAPETASTAAERARRIAALSAEGKKTFEASLRTESQAETPDRAAFLPGVAGVPQAGQKVQGTVLFSDVYKFRELVTYADEETSAHTIAVARQFAREIALAHNGVELHGRDGGCMFFFSTPEQAMQAGVEMQRRSNEAHVKLDVSLAAGTGVVNYDSLGQLQVWGDPTNTAAKNLSAAKGGIVFTSEVRTAKVEEIIAPFNPASVRGPAREANGRPVNLDRFAPAPEPARPQAPTRGPPAAELRQIGGAVLITDLEGSTVLNRRIGALDARKAVGASQLFAIEIAARHGGTAVKTTGDGVIFHFPDIASAERAAAEIRAEMSAGKLKSAAGHDLRLRVGVAEGPFTQITEATGVDILGRNVMKAIRAMEADRRAVPDAPATELPSESPKTAQPPVPAGRQPSVLFVDQVWPKLSALGLRFAVPQLQLRLSDAIDVGDFSRARELVDGPQPTRIGVLTAMLKGFWNASPKGVPEPGPSLSIREELQRREGAAFDGSSKQKALADLLAVLRRPDSPAVAALKPKLEQARVLARDGRHVEALAALDAALSDAQGADENVLQWLWDEADIIENDVQLRSGVDRRYSEESWREKPDARTVLAMARRAYARDSSNVVGLFTSKEVALQGQCSDCAVRSVSNNNSTKYLVEDMPYEQLRAFSAKVAKADVANRGMSHEELTQVMARLGLELSPRLRPTSEQELLDAVREANGVMASFAFKESVPDPTGDRWFRHAVAITGAFREGKAWRFVVKNSHFREPRLYSFAELRLWGLWIRSVEPSAALKARAGTLPLSRQESAMRWAQRRQAFDALAEEGLDVP